MKILILGAGATGGFYGARLQQADRDVTFLVREARAAQLRETGLRIVTPTEAFTVTPQLRTAAELRAQADVFDLVILSPKAYQLADALDDIAPSVGPETMILPFLNGMAHIDALITRFGQRAVLGGTCRIVSDMLPDGSILQLTELNELAYGELWRQSGLPADSERIQRLHATLSGCRFDAVLAPDAMAAMWKKWWILASMGAICVLADGSVGDSLSVAGYGQALNRAVVDECTAIAAANGFPADSTVLADETARLLKPGSKLTSSLFRDMSKGRPVEADHILRDLLARSKGVATPLINAAYVRLKVYEARRAAAV